MSGGMGEQHRPRALLHGNKKKNREDYIMKTARETSEKPVVRLKARNGGEKDARDKKR